MPGLEHLSEEQQKALIRRYYAGERVPDLIEEYELQVSAGRLYTLFPWTTSESPCEWCGGTMAAPAASRSGKVATPTCQACGHVGTGRCRCASCKERAAQLAVQKDSIQRQELLSSYNERRALARDPETLTARERVLLAAVLRASSSEDPRHVAPLDSNVVPITPNSDWTKELVSDLVWSSALLVINPNSDLSAFSFSDGEDWRYFSRKVSYELNLRDADDALLWAVLHPDPVPHDAEEIDSLLQLWKEVATQEVLQYLLHQVGKYHLKFRVGPKTKATVEHVLDHYSTAQAIGFVWSAVKDAAALVQARELSLGHASNTIPGSIRRRADRYLANGWEAKNFGRDFACPQSVLSSTLFNSVLQIGDKGFTGRRCVAVLTVSSRPDQSLQ